MNMFKKNGGFTLVELIVVIAILAILAGVAVPLYSGYIAKANDAADYTLLDSVKTAAIFAATEKAEDYTVDADEIVVVDGQTTVDVITYVNGKDVAGATADDIKITVDVASYVGTIDLNANGATWLAEAAAPLEAGWNLSK